MYFFTTLVAHKMNITIQNILGVLSFFVFADEKSWHGKSDFDVHLPAANFYRKPH